MSRSQKNSESTAPNPAVGGGWLTIATNWSIAALSITAVGGFLYWSFNVGTRDPHDVPIIRAMEGPSRVTPENPGGEQASHQGLAVNTVQAEGGVEAPANTVALAPDPAELSAEDLAHGAESAPQQTASLDVDNGQYIDSPSELSESDLDAIEIIDQVSQTVSDQEFADRDPALIPRANIQSTAYSPAASKRPHRRPSKLSTVLPEVVEPTPAVVSTITQPAVESVPAGTRLIQLGAFDSASVAKSEWAKLLAKHSHLLEGKKLLVVEAQSGGRKFYRLRAVGFNSRDESSALCTALLALGTPCIPVTAR